MISFKPQVFVQGQWSNNAIRFATRAESDQYARDLMSRWTLVDTYRTVLSDDDVNYRYVDGRLIKVEPSA